MSDKWDFYFCRVNDKPASIFLDLGIRKQVPMKEYSVLLWVWVHFRTPRPDGLSDSVETPILNKIQDSLQREICKNNEAIYVGRITTDGRRSHFYYAKSANQFEENMRNARSCYPIYEFDWGEEDDSEWIQYVDVLYPSANDLRRMKNRDVVDQLVKNGDNASIVREIDHWIYFATLNSRSEYKRWAMAAGFQIVGEHLHQGQQYSFGLHISKNGTTGLDAIDSTVLELFEKAQEIGADYDGWGTSVKKPEDKESTFDGM